MTILRLAAIAAAGICGQIVWAHAPLETSIDVTVRAETMQLHVVMAPVAALQLVEAASPARHLTAEDLLTQKPAFIAQGAKLFSIIQLPSPLAPSQVEFARTDEGDVDYRITFPRPAPGLLMIDAVFLKRLGDGYGGMIDVHDAEGHRLGWDQLTHDNSSLVVMLPSLVLPARKN